MSGLAISAPAMCDGIFSGSIIYKFLLIQKVNKFENRSILMKLRCMKLGRTKKCASFLGHPVKCFPGLLLESRVRVITPVLAYTTLLWYLQCMIY